MIASQKMSVTDLKNKLLDVVRRVQRGEIVEITKDGKSVAILSPSGTQSLPVLGFAPLKMSAPNDFQASDGWTFDVQNLTAKKHLRRSK